MDIFDDPRVLPCGHSFCLKCISQIRAMSCPECRSPFSGPFEKLPPNWVVIRSLSQTPKPKEPPPSDPCQNCEKPTATLWCTQCLLALCPQCSTDIHAIRAMKTHSVVGIKEKKKSEPAPKCPTHSNEDCKGFCCDCKRLVCTLCILEDHKQHNTTSVAKYVNDMKMEVGSFKGKFKEGKGDLERLLDSKRIMLDEKYQVILEMEKELRVLKEEVQGEEKGMDLLQEKIEKVETSIKIFEKEIEKIDFSNIHIIQERIESIYKELFPDMPKLLFSKK
uniref:RING-type domain-containing protein n=1 Tax=Arcella intermedia TaxID=1963864 RepID=A0A6B2LCI8_9EUKA